MASCSISCIKPFIGIPHVNKNLDQFGLTAATAMRSEPRTVAHSPTARDELFHLQPVGKTALVAEL